MDPISQAGPALSQGQIYTIHISTGDDDKDKTPMSSYCLDLDSGSSKDGTSCQAWDLTGANNPRNMQWRAHGPDGEGFWRFENVASGTWLDMESTKNWGKPKVWGWSGNGSDPQRWEVVCRGFRMVERNLQKVKVGDAGCRVRNKGRDQWMAYGPGIPGVFMGLHNGADIVGINGTVEKHYFYFVNINQNQRNRPPPNVPIAGN